MGVGPPHWALDHGEPRAHTTVSCGRIFHHEGPRLPPGDTQLLDERAGPARASRNFIQTPFLKVICPPHPHSPINCDPPHSHTPPMAGTRGAIIGPEQGESFLARLRFANGKFEPQNRATNVCHEDGKRPLTCGNITPSWYNVMVERHLPNGGTNDATNRI